MKFRVEVFDIDSGDISVVLNPYDCEKIGLHPGDLAYIVSTGGRRICSLIIVTKNVPEGAVWVNKRILQEMKLESVPEFLEVIPAGPSAALPIIKSKLSGKKLSKGEIRTIIKEVIERRIRDAEISMFCSALMVNGMDLPEIRDLSMAMAEFGEIIEWPYGPIYDVHSIGGVPGNKTALITVPIVASFGIKIPKTSSRAITSAAGTADVMETLAPVSLSPDEIVEIVTKVNGVLAWGGALNIAPADDIMIETERVLSVDPEPLLLASIMSKKISMGINKLLIDIPTGTEAKIEGLDEAESLATKFIELGKLLEIHTRVAITYGGQPIGRTIGPALEAQEALEALANGDGSGSLVHKATALAGIILEEAGIASPGQGKTLAIEAFKSGKAYEKMKEIIEAQGGDPNVKPEDLPVGEYKELFRATSSGYVTHISNKAIVSIARAAGAPKDKGAGIRLHVKAGDNVKQGDPLFEIYAESEERLSEAIIVARRNWPIRVEGMLLKVLG
ncbi:MAG: AMP phosphorylase [Euryarchaeota archaeon]|nr:AMP phosphorylase [Euryarchaeota archaeon]MCD6158043.1 AMP phosphorylase [Euryarchaeota archaeon]